MNGVLSFPSQVSRFESVNWRNLPSPSAKSCHYNTHLYLSREVKILLDRPVKDKQIKAGMACFHPVCCPLPTQAKTAHFLGGWVSLQMNSPQAFDKG